MKKMMAGVAAFMFLAALTGSAFGEGKADESKALVKKAIEYLKANGKEKAMSLFNDPKGEFTRGELYIFAIDTNANVFANGGNSKLVGKNLIDLKDVDGKFFQKEFIRVGQSGGGWVDYKWTHPETKKISGKSTYVEQVDNIIVGCGYYK